jgi:hypothetical protein
MFMLLAGSGELFRGFLSPATTNGHTMPWPAELDSHNRAREAATDDRRELTLSAGYWVTRN